MNEMSRSLHGHWGIRTYSSAWYDGSLLVLAGPVGHLWDGCGIDGWEMVGWGGNLNVNWLSLPPLDGDDSSGFRSRVSWGFFLLLGSNWDNGLADAGNNGAVNVATSGWGDVDVGSLG